MKIACEMQINILHRNNLSITAACRPAFHPKAWAKRWFTKTDNRLLTNRVQTITKPNCCCGLAFASWCRVNRGNKNQLCVWLAFLFGNPVKINLGLIMAIWFQGRCRNGERISNFLNWYWTCGPCDIDDSQLADPLISVSPAPYCFGSVSSGIF